MSEKPHKRLIVWQRAMNFIETVYKLTDQFPTSEQFSVVTQLRRAAISVASNIAEGSARQTVKEHLQFFYVARGSISELDTQIEIARRLIEFFRKNGRFSSSREPSILSEKFNKPSPRVTRLEGMARRATSPARSSTTWDECRSHVMPRTTSWCDDGTVIRGAPLSQRNELERH